MTANILAAAELEYSTAMASLRDKARNVVHTLDRAGEHDTVARGCAAYVATHADYEHAGGAYCADMIALETMGARLAEYAGITGSERAYSMLRAYARARAALDVIA